MLAGPGSKTLIKLPKTDGASGCRITITRLPALGPDPAGSYDPDPLSPDFQTYLHVRAVFPTIGGNVCTDGTGAVPPLTDFDPEDIEIFPPECTQLELVGGVGRYGVLAEMVPIVANAYAPCPRRLVRYLSRLSQFSVPPGHSGIGTLDSAATLTNLSDGGTILLTSSWPSLIPSGTQLQNPNANPVLVWTSFDA